MAELVRVSQPDNKGVRKGWLQNVEVTFGKVPEAPAWRTGPQQEYHSQKCWWVKREDERNSVYVFAKEPKQGSELDFRSCVAKHAVSDLAL